VALRDSLSECMILVGKKKGAPKGAANAFSLYMQKTRYEAMMSILVCACTSVTPGLNIIARVIHCSVQRGSEIAKSDGDIWRVDQADQRQVEGDIARSEEGIRGDGGQRQGALSGGEKEVR